MGKIISIINQKGGVGKTTTAVNLAAFLADKGYKTMLVDADSQGNATSGLSKDVEFEETLYDVLLDDVSIEEAVVKTDIKKLSILPASIDLAGAEIEMVSMEKREFLMKRKLDQVCDKYDFILIDCPPSLGLMTLNALVASQEILIPIQAEFYALEGLSQLVKTVQVVTRLITSRHNFLYASAPLDFGAYVSIGSPKLGASDNFTDRGITVRKTLFPKYFFTSSAT